MHLPKKSKYKKILIELRIYRHIFRLQLQRVIEIHVKLNKEDKGVGGTAGLVVRASDSGARVRVSFLTRVTMLCP